MWQTNINSLFSIGYNSIIEGVVDAQKEKKKLSSDAMLMMIQRDLMAETGVYDTVNSTPSSMDDPYAHVM